MRPFVNGPTVALCPAEAPIPMPTQAVWGVGFHSKSPASPIPATNGAPTTGIIQLSTHGRLKILLSLSDTPGPLLASGFCDTPASVTAGAGAVGAGCWVSDSRLGRETKIVITSGGACATTITLPPPQSRGSSSYATLSAPIWHNPIGSTRASRLFLTYAYAFQDCGSVASAPRFIGSGLVNRPTAEA